MIITTLRRSGEDERKHRGQQVVIAAVWSHGAAVYAKQDLTHPEGKYVCLSYLEGDEIDIHRRNIYNAQIDNVR